MLRVPLDAQHIEGFIIAIPRVIAAQRQFAYCRFRGPRASTFICRPGSTGKSGKITKMPTPMKVGPLCPAGAPRGRKMSFWWSIRQLAESLPSLMVIPRRARHMCPKCVGDPAATGRRTFHPRLGWSLSLAQSNFSRDTPGALYQSAIAQTSRASPYTTPAIASGRKCLCRAMAQVIKSRSR